MFQFFQRAESPKKSGADWNTCHAFQWDKPDLEGMCECFEEANKVFSPIKTLNLEAESQQKIGSETEINLKSFEILHERTIKNAL